jgi:hypothetical protein
MQESFSSSTTTRQNSKTLSQDLFEKFVSFLNVLVAAFAAG